jgi:hypothetical protein
MLIMVLAVTVIVYLNVITTESSRRLETIESVVLDQADAHTPMTTATGPTTTTTTSEDPDRVLNDEPSTEADIAAECLCRDESSGRVFDFCYHLPELPRKHGISFSHACKSLPALIRLGLFDTKAGDYLNLTLEEMPEPHFVTAFSANHYSEGRRLITELQRWVPLARIVVYDLGLSTSQVDEVKRMCQTQYRKFPFESFTPNVRALAQFRWKPIVIAESVNEFGAVWYMDSSVKFKKGDLSHVYALLNCRKKRVYLPPSFNRSAVMDTGLAIESGWHKHLWRDSLARCDKYAYMLHGWTGHGIYPATHPEVYKYLPSNIPAIKHVSGKMYEAGFALVVRTREVVRDVLKWYVLCGLEPSCMAPPGSHTGCRFGGDRFGVRIFGNAVG